MVRAPNRTKQPSTTRAPVRMSMRPDSIRKPSPAKAIVAIATATDPSSSPSIQRTAARRLLVSGIRHTAFPASLRTARSSRQPSGRPSAVASSLWSVLPCCPVKPSARASRSA